MKIDKIVFGVLLIAFGVFLYLRNYGLVVFDMIGFFSYAFMVYGLAGVLFITGKNHPAKLFASACALMAGIIIYTVHNYEIFSLRNFSLSSVLIITGAGFLSLYIDNLKEKGFLIASAVLISLSFLTATLLNDLIFIRYINGYTLTMLNYWPYYIIFAGITMLAKK